MEPSRPGTVVALLLGTALCATGFWLGEEGGPPWAAVPIVTGLLGCLLVAFSVPGRLAKKASFAVAVMALYGLAFFAGLGSFSRAFSECIEKGESVRIHLAEYHRTKSAYPESLAQLGVAVPCDRISRPTILRYEGKSDGYDLRFGDWLLEHSASESEMFMAHK
jgi:hypothetical protein